MEKVSALQNTTCEVMSFVVPAGVNEDTGTGSEEDRSGAGVEIAKRGDRVLEKRKGVRGKWQVVIQMKTYEHGKDG